MFKARQTEASGTVDVNIAQPSAVYIIVLGRILLSICNVEIRPDALNVKWSKAFRELIVVKTLFPDRYALEVSIVDSTCPLWKFVTKRYFFPSISPIVAPLYTALSRALFFTITALVPVPEFQAEIVPSSVTKMKTADLPFIRKSVGLPLKTIPVGLPVVPFPEAEGIVTTRDSMFPAPS
jgi:hypothetical protein